MTLSALTGYSGIPDGSDATPGLWDRRFTVAHANIEQLQSDVSTLSATSQHLSMLSLGAGGAGVLLSAITTLNTLPSAPVVFGEMIGGSAASGPGSYQGVEGYVKHTAASGASLAIAVIGNVENAGSGTVDDARAVQGGGWLSASGGATTFAVFFATPPAVTGAGRPGLLVAFSGMATAGNPWSGTTNWAIRTNGPVSLVSSTASLGTPPAGEGFLYVNSGGSLYFVNSNGSTLLA